MNKDKYVFAQLIEFLDNNKFHNSESWLPYLWRLYFLYDGASLKETCDLISSSWTAMCMLKQSKQQQCLLLVFKWRRLWFGVRTSIDNAYNQASVWIKIFRTIFPTFRTTITQSFFYADVLSYLCIRQDTHQHNNQASLLFYIWFALPLHKK